MKNTIQRTNNRITWWYIIPTLCFWFVLSFSFPAWGQSKRSGRGRSPARGWSSQGQLLPQDWQAAKKKKANRLNLSSRSNRKRSSEKIKNRGRKRRTDQNLSPSEKDRLKSKVKQWESLPPEKRQELRRRMKRWKKLSPEERQLFRKRHEQWQKFSPNERKMMRKQLEMWDKLTPQERKEIRQRFRSP
jgi:hypothetical protein